MPGGANQELGPAPIKSVVVVRDKLVHSFRYFAWSRADIYLQNKSVDISGKIFALGHSNQNFFAHENSRPRMTTLAKIDDKAAKNLWVNIRPRLEAGGGYSRG
jgi:hypothetical protein